MERKQMISIRFDKKLLQHLRKLQAVKSCGLTAYIEDACKAKSGYKEKELV